MADLDSHRLLPPFAIRDLHGPYVPPGVVHISASQYDETVHTRPDAVLSYVDLDDGEVITVGSSFELQQRLDEPAPKTTFLVPPHPKATRLSQENKMMHIFDIKKTSTSLAVWLEHAERSHKTWTHYAISNPNISSLPESSTVSLESQTAADVSTTDSNPNEAPAVPSESSQETEIVIPAEMDKYIADVFNRLQSRLGPLADFLDSTADGLRKIAEKTAESDTTPVENVLRGFKGILTEVGEFGVEFFSTLNSELENNKAATSDNPPDSLSRKQEGLPSSSKALFESKQPSTEQIPSPKVGSPSKRVAFAEERPVVATQESMPLQDPNPQPSASSASNSLASQGKVSIRPNVTRVSYPRDFAATAPAWGERNSIIDSEPADPDFSIRYPPLPTLRKAVSVSGLQDKTMRPVAPPPLAGMNPTAAMARYPSIGQFEEQTRPKSTNKSGSQLYVNDAVVAEQPRLLEPAKPKKTDMYKKPTVEEEAVMGVPANSKLEAGQTSAQWPTTSLPGAWPISDLKVDDWSSALPRNSVLSSKYSTAAPQLSKVSTGEQFPEGISHRISSPVSDTFARRPIFPRKSQTVSGTNPAARLNGPFDPLAHIPVLQPRPQQSQPDLAPPKPVSENMKNDVLLPWELPRRARTVHHADRYKPRDLPKFTPLTYSRPTLWDTYVKNNSSTTSGYSSASQLAYPRVPYPSSGADGLRLRTAGDSAPWFNRPDLLHRRPVNTQGPHRLNPATGPSPATDTSTPPSSVLVAPSAPVLGAQRRDPRHMRSVPNLPHFTATQDTTLSGPAPPPASSTTSLPVRSQSVFVPSPPAPFTRPRGRSGVSPPVPSGSVGVDECVKTLKSMGFGSEDANEFSRLNVYASVAAGNVEAAIEMIEEDREAAKALEENSQVEGIINLENFDEEH